MKNDILTLCNSAHDYNGQLVIVGTLTSIHAPTFPTINSLALVARFCFEQEEVNNINVRLEMITPDGSHVPLVQPSNISVAFNAPKSYLNINMGLNSIMFEKPGLYEIVLIINEQQFSTDLFVETSQKQLTNSQN